MSRIREFMKMTAATARQSVREYFQPVVWVWRFLTGRLRGPKFTVESVAQRLVAGKEGGSIVLVKPAGPETPSSSQADQQYLATLAKLEAQAKLNQDKVLVIIESSARVLVAGLGDGSVVLGKSDHSPAQAKAGADMELLKKLLMSLTPLEAVAARAILGSRAGHMVILGACPRNTELQHLVE
jgi:hypothetical protein